MTLYDVILMSDTNLFPLVTLKYNITNNRVAFEFVIRFSHMSYTCIYSAIKKGQFMH